MFSCLLHKLKKCFVSLSAVTSGRNPFDHFARRSLTTSHCGIVTNLFLLFYFKYHKIARPLSVYWKRFQSDGPKSSVFLSQALCKCSFRIYCLCYLVTKAWQYTIFIARNSSCGKVIFSEVSVSHSVHRGG